ncbi:MAG: GIY-YIG nuclease family protein, partial [Terriglobales bacterium]
MFIYLITNLVNGKYYVGQTARSVQERFGGHCLHSRQGSVMRIHAAMRKYGTSNFIVEQLACAEEQKQTDLLERLWIAALDSRNFSVGYNASPGGDARSKESAAKASAKMRGALNPNFGKTMSEEQ